MAFTRPSYDALVARVASDMRTQLVIAGKRADTLLRRSKMWVLSRVYAAIYHVLYGLLEWLSLQILPSTSTDLDYLRAFAATYGIFPKPATRATGTVTFYGANDTLIPTGSTFVRDDGVTYATVEDGTIVAGTAIVEAQADEVGSAGNMGSGTILSLSSPIAGIDTPVEWTSSFDDGTDDETLEELRTRLLATIARVPHGGAIGDYETWALEYPGVYRALAIAAARGAGTVDLYFLHTGGTGIGIPTSGQITDLTTYMNGPGRRPVTVDLEVKAPVEVAVAFTFGALEPDTGDVRDGIEAVLEDLFASVALVRTELYPSDFYAALALVESLTGFDLDVPAASVTCDPGEVLVLGTITWPS
jgi:uncharacterized phage protein gp47/JayE